MSGGRAPRAGGRYRSRRRLEIAAAAALLAVLVAPVRAELSEIRSQGQRINAELGRLRAAGSLDHAAERRLIQDLGPLVLSFIAESDEAARAGREVQASAALRAAFEAVHGPLDAIYTRVSSELESKARAIMDADGDLEALYETPEWHAAQAVAAEALYFRNWLSYYGARLYDGARRKTLLEAAERGFSEFAVGDRRGELLIESLLGRALCHLELGNYEWAIRDLRIVAEEPTVSAERKAKARLALLETYVRAGKRADALQHSQRLLASADLSSGDAAIVRFFRLQVLLDAISKVSAAQADAYRAEAAGLMERLRRAGPGWASKVDAVLATGIDDPSQWVGKARSANDKWQLARMLLQKENYDAAAPLLQQIVESESGDAKPYRAEASYWLGVARFRAEDYGAASERLAAALSDPGAPFAAEAAYLRFKALEALMAKEATAELAERYRAAMDELLSRHPDHPSANEARYRLGELLQARGDFEAALARYAEVADDEKFAYRAAFGSLQSRFGLLEQEADPSRRGHLIAAIGEDFRRLHEHAPAIDPKRPDPELNELLAKATLLEAVYTSMDGGGEGPDQAKVAKLLDDFPARFPKQPALFPQAARLRLAALREAGDFVAAREEIEKASALLAEEAQKEHVERLAVSFVRAAGRRRAAGDAKGAAEAEQAALALYELSVEEGNARRDLTVARLYESTGKLDDAARAYEKVLAENPNSLSSLEGLARMSEKRGDVAAARGFWQRYTSIARPGDAPWYRGHYQQARLALAGGEKQRSCEMLRALRPSMPGLSDEDLRRELGELYDRACG